MIIKSNNCNRLHGDSHERNDPRMESLKIRLQATWMAGDQRFPMLMMLPVLLLETKHRHHKSGNSKSNPSQAHGTWGSHNQLIAKAQKLK